MPKPDKRKIAIPKTHLAAQLQDQGASMFNRYRIKVYGEGKFLPFFKYELSTFLFGNVSGGVGYMLRKMFYCKLFRATGRGIIFGKGIALRHPKKITLGDRVAIDDYVLLDASGAGKEGIIIGNEVIISRNCVIQGKTGMVSIGDKTDIGCNCIFSSVTGIFIGHSNLIAGNCYIGGGQYLSDRLDMTMMDQGLYSEGPIFIGDDVWFGAGTVVLDGVRVGNGCIIGAGAIVTKDLPEYSIAAGAPARVIFLRRG